MHCRRSKRRASEPMAAASVLCVVLVLVPAVVADAAAGSPLLAARLILPACLPACRSMECVRPEKAEISSCR